MTATAVLAGHCRNCEAALGDPPGNYCPHCGQDTAGHAPSFLEFVHEFIGHYIALEGRLWRTLIKLFFLPGELTKEYLRGRKLRYVLPLRLYLTASFLFFLLVKVIGNGSSLTTSTINGKPATTEEALAHISQQIDDAKKDGDAASVAALEAVKRAAIVAKETKQKAAANGKAASAEEIIAKIGQQLDESPEKTSAVKAESATPLSAGKSGPSKTDTPSAPGKNTPKTKSIKSSACDEEGWLCDTVNRIKARYQNKNAEQIMHEVSARAVSFAPYAIFFMLPVYAALMQFVYVGRRMYYGEHFVFALHWHAFLFFLLLAESAAPASAKPILILLLAIYGFLAMHRVYRGRWWVTFLRYTTVSMLYMMLTGFVAVAVILGAVFF